MGLRTAPVTLYDMASDHDFPMLLSTLRTSLPIHATCLAALWFPSLTVGQTIGHWPDVAVPPGNPITPDKVLLGKALFFEEQLSADDTMACATCHLPEAGGGEARPPGRHPGRDGALDTEDDELGSTGVVRQDRAGEYRRDTRFEFSPQSTDRNSPSAYGAAFYDALFWDKRAGQVFRDLEGNVILPEFAALETQAVAPLTSHVEMANDARTWEAITTKLAAARPLALAHELPAELAAFVADASYDELFARAFGSEGITRERIAMALATFERILVPDQTPFDLGTMTPEQEIGFQVFRTRGSCTACHFETNRLFSDGVLHGINLPGHSRVVKTPNLRNVGLRRRLMSSGQFTDLDQVVSHYEEFGFFHSPLKPDERRALLDFLGNALTDKRVLHQAPPFDRPKLRSELEPFGSNLYGEGWPGPDGSLPVLIANTPANRGNADFKIGIGNALVGAPALLVLGMNRTRPGTQFRGVPLHVSLTDADIWVQTLAGHPGARRGVTTFHLPLPADPSIVGLQRFAQGFVLDPNALGGLTATPGAQFLVF